MQMVIYDIPFAALVVAVLAGAEVSRVAISRSLRWVLLGGFSWMSGFAVSDWAKNGEHRNSYRCLLFRVPPF